MAARCDRESRMARACRRSEFDGRRQAAYDRGEIGRGTRPQQPIESTFKAVQIHLAAGQKVLQNVDLALPHGLGDRRFGLEWVPVVVHGTKLSSDARSASTAGRRAWLRRQRRRLARRLGPMVSFQSGSVVRDAANFRSLGREQQSRGRDNTASRRPQSTEPVTRPCLCSSGAAVDREVPRPAEIVCWKQSVP